MLNCNEDQNKEAHNRAKHDKTTIMYTPYGNNVYKLWLL